MKGKRKEPWYKRIANVILEHRTFDVGEAQDGERTMAQMIALRIVDEI
jgi:hypothetical protein